MKLLAALALFLLLSSGTGSHADKEFEIEVYEKFTKFIQDYKLRGSIPDVTKYIPYRAGPLIDYAKRYFTEKTIMRNEAPKVTIQMNHTYLCIINIISNLSSTFRLFLLLLFILILLILSMHQLQCKLFTSMFILK